MKDNQWLREAMADDTMVAELLLHLKQSDPHPSALTRQAGAALIAALPPMDWGVRLPRSKAAAPSPAKKDREPARRSPTTPLSWSVCGVGSGGVGGGASASDGYEDSSRPPDRFVAAVRSKGTAATNETTTTSATGATKRQRRKKTFAELKEEESSLLKERSLLKRELDSIRVTLKEQRSLNEKLKRIKPDLDAQSGVRSVAALNHEDRNNRSEMMEVSTSTAAPRNSLKSTKREETSDCQDSCQLQNSSCDAKPIFVLPDLNMIPEGDSTPGKPEGMS